MENIRTSMQRLQYSFVDSADGIVVLSGGIKTEGDSKIIEWGDPDRFTE